MISNSHGQCSEAARVRRRRQLAVDDFYSIFYQACFHVKTPCYGQ